MRLLLKILEAECFLAHDLTFTLFHKSTEPD